MESPRKFGIYANFRGFIQGFGKLLLNALLSVSVGKDVVLDTLGALICLADWLRGLLLGENSTVVHLVSLVILNVLHNHRGFLLADDMAYLADKLFRVVLEHV